jgi:hypothetical protein
MAERHQASQERWDDARIPEPRQGLDKVRAIGNYFHARDFSRSLRAQSASEICKFDAQSSLGRRRKW